MIDLKKLALLKESLNNAESSINTAKHLLADVLGETDLPKVDLKSMTSLLPDASENDGGKIVEGVFDGQGMVDKEGRTYPVPANYASKSKLVTGDVLKLTITEEGRFLYKQIGPAERKYVVGPLTYDEGQYKVITQEKTYKVLTASVTYFKGDIGDEITLIVPQQGDSEWGAVEAILPRFESEAAQENEPKKAKSKKDLDELDGTDLDF